MGLRSSCAHLRQKTETTMKMSLRIVLAATLLAFVSPLALAAPGGTIPQPPFPKLTMNASSAPGGGIPQPPFPKLAIKA